LHAVEEADRQGRTMQSPEERWVVRNNRKHATRTQRTPTHTTHRYEDLRRASDMLAMEKDREIRNLTEQLAIFSAQSNNRVSVLSAEAQSQIVMLQQENTRLANDLHRMDESKRTDDETIALLRRRGEESERRAQDFERQLMEMRLRHDPRNQGVGGYCSVWSVRCCCSS